MNDAAFTTSLPVLVNTTLPLEKETEREHVPEPPVVLDFAVVAVPVVVLAVVVVDDLAEVELVVDDFAEVAADPLPEPAAQFVLTGDSPFVEHMHCSASEHVGVFVLPLHGTCLYVTTGLFQFNAEI